MVCTGSVRHGSREGTRLGFPTVNIPLTGAAVSGIFAARIRIGENVYTGVAYANPKKGVLEAHIFDFAEDVYGFEIEVELIEKLREDQSFVDEDEAKAVIRGDIARARTYFNSL